MTFSAHLLHLVCCSPVPSLCVTYRKSEVEVVEYLVHGAPDREYFERPPFVARINSLTVSGLPDFILIGVHIRPDSAEAELNNLVGVYEDMNAYFGIDKALLLGDFNAGCRYLSKTAFNRLNLTSDDRFTWLIDDDTTVAKSSCAYDRQVPPDLMLCIFYSDWPAIAPFF